MQFHIEADVLNKALCQPTYFKVIDGNDIFLSFYEVAPLDGYTMPANFPNCCSFHKGLLKAGTKFINKFPNCCKGHQEVAKRKTFDKSQYLLYPDKLIKQVSYTEHCIFSCIALPDWYSAITEYIEWNVESFGSPQVGEHIYLDNVKYIIEHHNSSVSIPEDRKEMLIKFIDEIRNPSHEIAEPTDVNELYSTYQRWLKLFPFGIVFFDGLKNYYTKKLPFLVDKPHVNRYSGMAKSKLITEDKLIEHLNKITKDLLSTIDTTSMVKTGLITDADRHKYELILESHRITQLSNLTTFKKGESEYSRVIKDWLKNEKDFFAEIAPFVIKVAPPQQSKSEQLSKALSEYGFFELEKVKAKQNIASMIIKLSGSELPYQIAMLDFLGFIPHLEKEHSTRKKQVNKLLSQILNANERAVKGNISVLNDYSTEDKARYTANQHKERVKKDYQKLK